MIIDERAEPRYPPAATNAARRLMREDPMAQGGGDVGSNDATNALESSPESVRGGVAVFLAKDGDWSAHEAMVKQAPRLAHLAQSRGAVGALFLWPDGAPGRPPVQPLLANPNYDIALGIPVATLPARDFDAVLSSSAAGRNVSIAPRVRDRRRRWRDDRRRVSGGVRVSTGRGGGGRERQSEFGRGSRRGVGEDARQGGGGEARGGGGGGGGGGTRKGESEDDR